MSDTTTFDYYYGDEGSQFSFYRIPRQLITSEQFRRLSTDAKLLYGLLLDRMSLSAKNGWYDDLGRIYIYYTLYLQKYCQPCCFAPGGRQTHHPWAGWSNGSFRSCSRHGSYHPLHLLVF